VARRVCGIFLSAVREIPGLARLERVNPEGKRGCGPGTLLASYRSARSPGSKDVSPVLHTILLVEADEVVRNQRVHQLLREGHIVLTAADASDAIATLRHYVGAIDAVVAGAEMPRVSAVRPGTPVLVVSGDAGPAIQVSSA
jgi:hypothetical protein